MHIYLNWEDLLKTIGNNSNNTKKPTVPHSQVIGSFDEEYAFLPNFYEAPIVIDGIVYPANNHAF